VELRKGGVRLFMKVVLPDETALLHRRHAVMSACLPVPHSHGWSDPAIVAEWAAVTEPRQADLATSAGKVRYLAVPTLARASLQQTRDGSSKRFARGKGGGRRSDGAALGLAIVKTIAEAHGATSNWNRRPEEDRPSPSSFPRLMREEVCEQDPHRGGRNKDRVVPREGPAVAWIRHDRP
jgi:hypothetical protein